MSEIDNKCVWNYRRADNDSGKPEDDIWGKAYVPLNVQGFQLPTWLRRFILFEMKTYRTILSGFLILMLLSSGMPLFSPPDADRNGAVDLRDAVLNARRLAGAADRPGTFRTGIRNIISSLRTAAGLKSDIGPEKSTKSAATRLTPGFPYLLSTTTSPAPARRPARETELSTRYESIVISPDAPPPRKTFVS